MEQIMTLKMKQSINRHSMIELCRNIFTSRLLVIAIMSTAVSACGGGGDEAEITSIPTSVTPVADTTTTTTTPPATTTPDPEPEPAAAPTSLDDLIVDADNEMQAAFQLAVSIDLDSTRRAYFSLCDEFSDSNNKYTVNFESCQYRGPTESGKLNTHLKIANHNEQLIAVLWFYDGAAPKYQLWQYDDQAQEQRLWLN